MCTTRTYTRDRSSVVINPSVGLTYCALAVTRRLSSTSATSRPARRRRWFTWQRVHNVRAYVSLTTTIVQDESIQSCLHVSFTNNLPPSSSSFSAECYAITEALISNLAPNKYLIVSDSMSCLQSLKSCPFNSKLSPLVFRIN